MAKAIVLNKFGSIQNLNYEDSNNEVLKLDEIRIKQTAIGVNFLDIYHRQGTHFSNISLPGIIGVEGVGIIEKVHPSVDNFNVGDKIGYPLNTGGYASHRNINSKACIKIPEGIDDKIIAASLMKGITVSHILFDIINIAKGNTILWHAAAGGVGMIACQWAKNLGATVIGTVGSDDKIEIVKDYGCDFAINYTKEVVSEKVFELTQGKLCDAVIDGVGKNTWLETLKSIKPYGKCVSFGLASGPLPSFGFDQIPAESFITRATVGSVIENKNSLEENCKKYFKALKDKAIKPRIDSIFKLEDAGKAHEILENRKNIGSIVLEP